MSYAMRVASLMVKGGTEGSPLHPVRAQYTSVRDGEQCVGSLLSIWRPQKTPRSTYTTENTEKRIERDDYHLELRWSLG